MAGPCRCRSAHPEAERMQTCSLSESDWVFRGKKSSLFVALLFFFSICSQFSFDKARMHVCLIISMCVCVWACKQKWRCFSYVRAVWLLAGQFLKNLKCGHTPHVTGQREFKSWAENFLTFSNLFPVVSGFHFSDFSQFTHYFHMCTCLVPF